MFTWNTQAAILLLKLTFISLYIFFLVFLIKNSKIFLSDQLIMNIYNLMYNKIEEDMLYTGKYEMV